MLQPVRIKLTIFFKAIATNPVDDYRVLYRGSLYYELQEITESTFYACHLQDL